MVYYVSCSFHLRISSRKFDIAGSDVSAQLLNAEKGVMFKMKWKTTVSIPCKCQKFSHIHISLPEKSWQLLSVLPSNFLKITFPKVCCSKQLLQWSLNDRNAAFRGLLQVFLFFSHLLHGLWQSGHLWLYPKEPQISLKVKCFPQLF